MRAAAGRARAAGSASATTSSPSAAPAAVAERDAVLGLVAPVGRLEPAAVAVLAEDAEHAVGRRDRAGG